jgi:hypothetical protein
MMAEAVSIQGIAEAIWAWGAKRLPLTLERAQYDMPIKEDTIMALCLEFGVYEVIEKLVQAEEELREFCDQLNNSYGLELNISYNDDRRRILQIIQSKIDSIFIYKTPKIYWLSTLHKNLTNIIEEDDYNIKLDLVVNCAKKLERIIIECFRVYMGYLGIEFVSSEDQTSIQNILSGGKIKLATATECLLKYEKMLRKGELNDFSKYLDKINDQSSILSDMDLSKFELLPKHRNRVIHEDPDEKETDSILHDFDYIVRKIAESFPIMFIPVQYGIDDKGSQYVLYVDEEISEKLAGNVIDFRLCKKMYFYITLPQLNLLKPSYVFSPNRHSLIVDPLIVESSL